MTPPLTRALWILAGLVALALGALGIFLPLLPTTPFVLLAAACFARGSRRLHDALLAHRIAGPMIREWNEHRSMPARAKRWAWALMALSFGVSIAVVPEAWHRLLLAAVGLALAAWLWRVPVRAPDAAPQVASRR